MSISTNLEKSAHWLGKVNSARELSLINSLNKAVRSARKKARTGANSLIRKKYNVKAKQLTKTFTLLLANPNRLESVVKAQGFRISLRQFSARQTKKGVTVKIFKAGSRKLISGAFFATMPSGHKAVAERMSGWKHREPKGREGIFHGLRVASRTTASVAQMFNNKGVVKDLQKFVSVDFQDLFDDALRKKWATL
jgi:hypothetical protein